MKNLILSIFILLALFPESQAAAPVIVTQPESKIVPRATATSLTVAVQNTSGVTYQWLFNGSPMTGKTAATLSFTSITLADAGKYEVITHNSSGDTRSAPAFITVADYQVIHSFRFIDDGGSAQTPIVQDVDGKLYGTSFEGSDFGGVLFRLNEDGSNYQALKKFADGTHPFSSLALLGNSIYFYASSSNSIFAIDKTGTNGRILTRFIDPNFMNNFVLASDGFLYVTATGSSFSDPGRIYRVDPATGQSNLVHQLVEDFNLNKFEGSGPRSLIQGADGALYGVTGSGGDLGSGTLFRMELDGSNFRVVKAFSDFSMNVIGKLAQDADGNLYGLSSQGGTSSGGYMYRVKPDGSGYTVLYNFVESTGAGPTGGLTIAPDGTIFGVCSRGGSADAGVIFQYSRKGVYQILHRFDTFGSGDGMFPVSEMMLARDGTLYGVTPSGGANGTGVIFKIPLVGLPKPPQFTRQPSNHIARTGETVILQAEVSGGAPLTYRWFFNGAQQSVTATPELRLENIQASAAGSYQLIASNSFGVNTSQVAIVTVRDLQLTPGILVGWGGNQAGQLRDAYDFTPPLTNIIAIAATTNETIVARADGSVLAWGSNGGVTTVPVSATNVMALAGGNQHVLALRGDGSLISWGTAAFGKTNVPANATNIVAITALQDFSAALRADGRVFVWGSYWNVFQYEPVSFPLTLNDVIDIGGRYALRRDGTVVDWIKDFAIPSVSNLVSIANEVGVRSNTTVAVWGDLRNGAGNLPTGLSNVVSVAAGVDHRLAVRSDGSVVAWGTNNMGQTNIPIGLKAIKAAGGLTHSLAIATADSVLPGRFQFAGSGTARPRENAGSVQLIVERVGGSSGAVSVRYQTVDGTAFAGEDYVEASGTLSFADGQSRATINISLIDDLFDEHPEAFFVQLSEPTGGADLGPLSEARVVISGDESILSFDKAEYSINETSAFVTVRVSRSGNTLGAVSVDVSTAPGSATDPADYTATAATLSWADGESISKEINIPIKNNAIQAGDKAFSVRLTNPTGAPQLGVDTATVWIIDDESPPVIEIAQANYEFSENDGFAVIKVVRKGGASIYGVTLRAVNGTAIAGQDFEAFDEGVSFAQDEAIKLMAIPLIDSIAVEGDETFQVQIENPAGGASLGAIKTATVTIHDPGLSPEDIYGHGLSLTSKLIDKNDPAQTFTIEVTVHNPGPARSNPGFLVVNNIFLATGDTNQLSFEAIEPGGDAVISVEASAQSFGVVYATAYERVGTGVVPQASIPIYEFFATAPPTGGVPSGDQQLPAPGLSLPPKLLRVELTGPSQILGGQTGTFLAAGVFDNNTTNQNVAVAWKTTIGTISTTGLLRTQPVVTNTIATVTATITVGADSKFATSNTTILAPPKTNPVLSWSPPATIAYGTALSPTQLSATANVAGTFAYSPGLGTVLPAGTHNLRATFTPENTSAFNGGETNVTITVNKADPVIDWPTPSQIFYGTPLSDTQLNATATPPGGTFFYAPAAGTVLGAGMPFLSVTYTPPDTTNYNTVLKGVQIIVLKATPVITWEPPAIVYGTPLSDTQLNATANVAGGTFVYTPPAGTILSAGSPIISVRYTPQNPANYNSTMLNMPIVVAKAPQTLTFDLPTFALLSRTITLNGQATSGLSVSYLVNGPGAVQNGMLSFSNSGEVTVTASQDGNENYLAAPAVSKSVSVIDAAKISLKIEATQGSRVITWPEDGGLLILETTAALGASAAWSTAPGTIDSSGGQRRYVIQPGGQTQFYRLRAGP